MKKLIIILCVLVIACKKTTTPAPASPGPAATTSSLSSLDSAMIGDWALDSTIYYNNGAVVLITPYTDPINCHLVMTSVELDPGNPQLWKNCTRGLECVNSTIYWRTNITMPNRLDLNNVIYTIVSSGSNKLVLQYGSITPTGGQAWKYYLHK